MDTALASAEWQAFTQAYWHVEPLCFEYAPRGPGGPTLKAICYSDRKGRIVLPSYQPHLPLAFKPTPTDAVYRRQRQWLEIACLFVDDMVALGIQGEVTFSPAVTDPRPWIWSHFRVVPRFTTFLDFPFSLGQADRVVRQQAGKASRAGFVCERTDKLDDVLHCLQGSESRRDFDYGVSLQGLEMARRLLGPEAFRTYVCHAPDGGPATARVVLHRPGGRACDWLAGTVDKHLHSGATQLLMTYMLDDLYQAGAVGYNSCGDDVESVSYAKTMWGGRLMTQYSIQAFDLASLKNLLGKMRRYVKRRATVRRSRATRPEVRPAPRSVAAGNGSLVGANGQTPNSSRPAREEHNQAPGESAP